MRLEFKECVWLSMSVCKCAQNANNKMNGNRLDRPMESAHTRNLSIEEGNPSMQGSNID